ncbi:MAG: YfhO family protein [Gemmatimonadota bacterium]
MSAGTGTRAATDGFTWPGGWVASAIYFGLAVVYFLPAFAPGAHIFGSDYLAGSYFIHDFISERFGSGSIPKWLPHIYGGLPLFSNPGSTFYPFRFLADLVFPTTRLFPTIYVLQVALGGIGAYFLTRELGARHWIAFLAGLAFEFTGLILSFVLGGHEGRMIVATFAPLFLFFIHRGVRTGGLGWFAGMAAVLGFSLLSFQIQSNYYLLLAGAAWAVFVLLQERNRLPGRALTTRTLLGLAAVAVAFGMAAVNFLPFLDYVDASPRGGPGRGYEYAVSWSMPPGEITGVVLPEETGVLEFYEGENPFKLHTEYVGAVVFLLFLVGLWTSRRDRTWWFFALLGLFALTISFGGHTPLYRLYYAVLPGTPRFRAPSISFFLVSMSLVVMAALTLERLAALRARSAEGRERDTDDSLRWVPWILAGASALALLLLLGTAGGAETGPRGQALARGAFRVALVTWITAGALWLWLRRSLDARLLVAILAVVTVADLWIVDRRFLDTVEPPEIMFAADGVVRALEDGPEPFRVWVLPAGRAPYRNGGNYLMYHGISQAGGEHGNHLQRWGEFVGAGEDVYIDWHNFLADLERLVSAAPGERVHANFLAAANIRYIVSTVGLPNLRELYRGPEALIYEVPGVLPRAWLASEALVATEPAAALAYLRSPDFDPGTTAVLERPLAEPLPATPLEGEARIVEYAPDRVRIQTTANRAALLVLADNHYEGWEATVDGDRVPVHRVQHTMRGVPVPAGTHEVVFRFRPADLYTGLIISAVAALLVVGAAVGPAVLRRRAATGDA